MTTTMTKPKAEPAEPDFKATEARFKKVSAGYAALHEAVENARAALLWSRASDSEKHSIATSVRERVQEAYPDGLPPLRKLARQAEDAAEALDDATPSFLVERELWAAASRRETARIALELQPRHRADVKAIAKALEDLSRSMAAEVETRAELARVAPEQSSAYLPNCSGFLSFNSLADWNTPVSQWAREMRRLKILE